MQMENCNIPPQCYNDTPHSAAGNQFVPMVKNQQHFPCTSGADMYGQRTQEQPTQTRMVNGNQPSNSQAPFNQPPQRRMLVPRGQMDPGMQSQSNKSLNPFPVQGNGIDFAGEAVSTGAGIPHFDYFDNGWASAGTAVASAKSLQKDLEAEEKLREKRERNRMSATRCRERRRRRMAELERENMALMQQNQSLQYHIHVAQQKNLMYQQLYSRHCGYCKECRLGEAVSPNKATQAQVSSTFYQ